MSFVFFFFNDTATTEIYTLSLHDALPISAAARGARNRPRPERVRRVRQALSGRAQAPSRSEEHTSELQSPCNLVCRLLLEKKKRNTSYARRVRNTWKNPSTSLELHHRSKR